MFVRSPGGRKIFMGEPFKLYASKETKVTIPPADLKLLQQLLPQWAGQNVILVSSKDLKPGAPPEGTVDQQYTAKFQNFLNRLPIPKGTGTADATLTDAYATAAKGEFAASAMPAFKQTGMMTVAVDYNHLNQFIPGGLAALPPGILKNVPGTSTDWMLATVAHESGHLSSVNADAQDLAAMKGKYSNADQKSVYTNDRETEADTKGLTNYFALRAQKPNINPDVPAAYMQLRALGTIRNSGDALSNLQTAATDHATNPALKIDGQTVKPVAGAKSAAIDAALIDVNTRTHLLLGLEFDKDMPAKAQQWAQTRAGEILSAIDDPGVKKAAAAEGKSVQDMFADGIGRDRTDLLLKISADPKAKDAMSSVILGAGLAHADPLHEYAAMKFLLAKNEFKTPGQQQIVKDYIAAFDKYVDVNADGRKMIAAYTAKMEKDWPQLQKDMAAAPLVQDAVNVSKTQLHEPQATGESNGPPTTAMG